ncbi:hypothetical protein [Pseudomonas syringae]|uniref:hypothetical protein n=1 Tax=Pseudomonas syringae TaxID=317 RepID=UPI003F8264EA
MLASLQARFNGLFGIGREFKNGDLSNVKSGPGGINQMMKGVNIIGKKVTRALDASMLSMSFYPRET